MPLVREASNQPFTHFKTCKNESIIGPIRAFTSKPQPTRPTDKHERLTSAKTNLRNVCAILSTADAAPVEVFAGLSRTIDHRTRRQTVEHETDITPMMAHRQHKCVRASAYARVCLCACASGAIVVWDTVRCPHTPEQSALRHNL